MSLPSDVTEDVTEAMERTQLPGRKIASRYTPEQRGWAAAIFIAFLGIAFVGPAWARTVNKKRSMKDRLKRRGRELGGRARDATKQARKKIRRLGGGSFTR